MTVLIVSDIHANSPALESVLQEEEPVDFLIMLGDAVDCGPLPSEVLETLTKFSGIFVLGNHDRAVLNARDCEASAPREQWQSWTRKACSAEQLRFLQSWERSTTIDRGNRTVRLHHGNFSPPPGFSGSEWQERIRGSQDRRTLESLARRYEEDVILHGHSHYPYRCHVSGTMFVNPGSVGLQRPGMDQPVARYGILDEDGIHLRTIEYPIDDTCHAMQRVPLPEAFIEQWNRCYRTGEGPRPA